MSAPTQLADPVAALTQRVRPMCRRAVDALQVAAVLESDGLTDRAAAEEYGYQDVFALAEEIFSRLPSDPPDEPARPRRNSSRTVRELSHGLLYVLPSAAFPAAYALLGLRGLVAGMVFATALGWVSSMGATVLAYRLIGAGHAALTARVLRRGLLLGLLVGAAGGLALTQVAGLTRGVIVLVTAQLAYQLASGVLLFYERERLLLLTMLPLAGAGAAHLAFGRPSAVWTAGIVVGSVSAAVLVALWRTRRPPVLTGALAPATPPPNLPPPPLRQEVVAVLPVVAYAALCATYLLFANARYIDAGIGLALAVTPLVLGMGALEWRARRFAESAVALTRRCRYPAEFAGQVWRLFGGGIGVVVGILTLLAAGLAALLAQAGLLSERGLVLAAAHVLLGGAYFVGFTLINHGRLPVLLGITAVALAGQVAATVSGLPYSHGVIFLTSSAALLALLLAALSTSLAEVRRYRW
ncbi:MAG: hypothetical protein GEU94_10455 [Micromonosporaceae bacterium]|nr:hypothetical protein [Micromonosporaceae bacterium]